MTAAQLHLGDCLDVLRGIPDGSVDMVLADLPYGATACRWDTLIPLKPLWQELGRVAKRNAAIVLTASQPFTSVLVMSNPGWFRYEWIWRKNQGVNPRIAKIQPLRNHENVLVFYRVLPAYRPQMWMGKPYRGFASENGATIGSVYSGSIQSRHRDNPDGSRFPLTVQDFRMEKGLHPTQKPVALGEYMIETYTEPGDVVLDPTMGSGSFGVAAIQTGRRFIGIEKDAGYFAIAQRRIAETQAEVAARLAEAERQPDMFAEAAE